MNLGILVGLMLSLAYVFVNARYYPECNPSATPMPRPGINDLIILFEHSEADIIESYHKGFWADFFQWVVGLTQTWARNITRTNIRIYYCQPDADGNLRFIYMFNKDGCHKHKQPDSLPDHKCPGGRNGFKSFHRIKASLSSEQVQTAHISLITKNIYNEMVERAKDLKLIAMFDAILHAALENSLFIRFCRPFLPLIDPLMRKTKHVVETSRMKELKGHRLSFCKERFVDLYFIFLQSFYDSFEKALQTVNSTSSTSISASTTNYMMFVHRRFNRSSAVYVNAGNDTSQGLGKSRLISQNPRTSAMTSTSSTEIRKERVGNTNVARLEMPLYTTTTPPQDVLVFGSRAAEKLQNTTPTDRRSDEDNGTISTKGKLVLVAYTLTLTVIASVAIAACIFFKRRGSGHGFLRQINVWDQIRKYAKQTKASIKTTRARPKCRRNSLHLQCGK